MKTPGESSQKKPKGRGPGKPFVKGDVSNPRGRPPLTDAQRLARTMRADAQPELVTALLEIVRDSAEAKDRIAAARALLEELPKEVDATLRGDGEGVVIQVVKYSEAKP